MITKLVLIGVDGMVGASIFFLVAVGLTLVYGVLRILNIAHGSLYGLGAYMGTWLAMRTVGWGWNPWLTYPALLVGAVAVGLAAGPVIERTVLRRIYDEEEAIQLLVTFATFLVLEDVTKLIWGVQPLYVSEPYLLLGQVSIVGVRFPVFQFLLVTVAVVTGGILWWSIEKTRRGKIILAVTADREMSGAMGINVSRVFVTAFTIGAIVAALGGAFSAPTISVAPGLSVDVIVAAFAVVVIGGLGSLSGSAVGAVLIGLGRAAAVHMFPEIELITIYVIMVMVLLARPSGLFGKMEARKI